MKISVSSLSAKNRIKFLETVDELADYIHIDVMDGIFVPDKQFELSEVEKIKEITTKPLDIHLMVQEVIPAILIYRTLSPEYLTFHLEAVNEPASIIELIKSFGIKVGISIKPGTELSKVTPYLSDVDQVLIMSVEPGRGGQGFLEETNDKIQLLKSYLTKTKSNTLISIDGGITKDVLNNLTDKPDIVVVGSYLSNSDDPNKLIKELKKD